MRATVLVDLRQEHLPGSTDPGSCQPDCGQGRYAGSRLITLGPIVLNMFCLTCQEGGIAGNTAPSVPAQLSRISVARIMPSAAEQGGHVRMLLGAYVLGGLSAAEVSTVQAHLHRCARCRAEHDELARVPAWLDLLTAPDPDTGSGAAAAGCDQDGDASGAPEARS